MSLDLIIKRCNKNLNISTIVQANCQCASDEQKCEHGGGCVMRSRVCDGRFDCPDRSDELNCLQLNETTLQIR